MRTELLLLALCALSACRDAGRETHLEANQGVEPTTNETGAADPSLAAGPSAPAAVAPSPAKAELGACRLQSGESVPANRLRAVGTEPFWGAKIDGRCVTYSHPDDLSGTRVWTHFSGTADAGKWSGALGGKPFVLTTRPRPDCSDGMSDRRYPVAVSLAVGGEIRQGCAEPL